MGTSTVVVMDIVCVTVLVAVRSTVTVVVSVNVVLGSSWCTLRVVLNVLVF
jgi:hypothetical protein